MDSAFDIADSTDWLNTPLKDFAPLENALHCQVCKEFLDTPMITSCSHTFCSKCIRTSLSADGKCPACRAPDQASKLRNNWALQEIVTMFVEARPAALKVAKKEEEMLNAQSRRPGKRKRVVLDSDDMAMTESDGRTTRSKSRKVAASQEIIVELDDTDGDADFEPEQIPDDGMVECPLGCGKRMKLELVEPHLDRCDDEKEQASRAKARPLINSSLGSKTQISNQQERISQLNYTLVKESALRKKMDELGIPNWGTKALMERRHKEWVNIWNANCDSSQPRAKRELLADLKAWERTQGGNAPHVTNHLMKKEFDGVGWANKHNDEFARLIADAKRQKPNREAEAEAEPGKGEDGGEVKDIVVGEGEDDTAHLTRQVSKYFSEDTSVPQPLQGNGDAGASVRREAEAADSAREIGPFADEGLQPCSDYPDHVEDLRKPDNASQPTAPESENATIQQSSRHHHRASSQDAHAVTNGDTRSSYQVSSHLAKRPPMFDVPAQQPLADTRGMGKGAL